MKCDFRLSATLKLHVKAILVGFDFSRNYIEAIYLLVICNLEIYYIIILVLCTSGCALDINDKNIA